jgi:hypothetical protein
MARALEDALAKRLLITIPPRHLKSIRLNLPQSSDATLDIRRLENGLERHGARSHPTTPPLASLAGLDALTGALRHGILGTIWASTENGNTWHYDGGVWLMTQSEANPSQGQNSLLNWEKTGNLAKTASPFIRKCACKLSVLSRNSLSE